MNSQRTRRESAPQASSLEVRERMMNQLQIDTKPELGIRSAVHKRGLRYRVNVSPVGGVRSRPDMVFRASKVAVFVDGCFWHGCPEHGTWPKTNATWWREKIEANIARDERVTERLEAVGWTVIRIWEHEDPDGAAERIENAVRPTDGRREHDE